MKAKVTKLTDVSLLQLANSFTSGKDSQMTLAKAYAHKHSPIRTQIFAIELRDIPLFVASQLVRSHVGVQWYQRSKRIDRGGADFNDICRNLAFEINTSWITHEAPEKINIARLANDLGEWAEYIERLPEKFDRYAPTDLLGIMNAEAIINMSRKRLCTKASPETLEIWNNVVGLIEEADPDLAKHCVPQCINCGYCPEPKGCKLIKTALYQKRRNEYLKLFT